MSTQPTPTVKTKRGINALAQYMLALAVVVGAYSLYLQFAVPAIEGPQSAAELSFSYQTPPFEAPTIDKSGWRRLLAPDAWELSDCKTLLTESGTILFKEFEQVDENTIKVVPFTLITGDGTTSLASISNSNSSSHPQSSATPTILRCIEGAHLRFDKPTGEVFRGNAKMKSARLTGSVDIYRPPNQADNSDSVEISTSDVQINENKIYTLSDVIFSFGPHHGSGRNLVIDLAHESEGVGSADDFSTINGIRRIELAFLDRLRIEVPPKQDEEDASLQQPTDSSTDEKLFSGDDSPLEITCTGPFVFDFESRQASFQENVIAKQLDASGNQINCDQLTLVFDSQPNVHQPNKGQSDSSGPNMNSDLRLRQFIATGMPAVVVSTSPPARVEADYLSYDVVTNRIDAHCEPSGERMVTLVSPDHQLVAKQLSYVIPDDGSIGPIQATGPGRLLRIASKKQDEFFVTWKHELTSRSDPDQPDLQHIEVNGDTRIRIGGETRVDSDRLELFIRRTPAIPVAGTASNKRKWEYHPSQLVMIGHVKIDSPQITGSADHLTAIWPDVSRPPLSRIPRSDPHVVSYRGRLAVQQPHLDRRTLPPLPSTHSPPRLALRPGGAPLKPIARTPQRRSGFVEHVSFQTSDESDTQPAKKINFRGQRVNIRLSVVNQETQIQDLTIVGDVFVTEVASPGNNQLTPHAQLTPKAATFQITGERLQMIPQSGDKSYRVLVSGDHGHLAKIVGKDFELHGGKINLDQTANKLWVEGAGTMKIQAPPDSGSKTNILPGQAVPQATPRILDVQWSSGMVFDGSKIYFEDDVILESDQVSDDGTRTNMKTFSQGLRVVLTRMVNFQGLTRSQNIGNPEIKELHFVDHVDASQVVFRNASHPTEGTSPTGFRPVIVKIQTYGVDHQQTEQIELSVPEATVNPVAGSIQCPGPGSLATHRIGKPTSEKSGNVLGDLTQSSNVSGISFIQVNFDGMMNLNSHQKDMKIDGNVRTVYASVPSWNDTIDPDDINSVAPGITRLTSDHLRLAEWKPRGSDEMTKEVMASGNVHARADTFEITADRVSYNQATETMTIEGSSRTNANLWYKKNSNDTRRSHMAAEKITHRLDGSNTQVSKVKNASYKGG